MTKAREIAELGQKLTVDGSGNLDIAGTVETDGALKVGSGSTLFGAADSGLNHYSNNYMYLAGGSNGTIIKSKGLATEYAKFEGSAISFNEDSNDMNFRVESNNNANALLVDAGADRVNFFTTAGYSSVNIEGNLVTGGTGNRGVFFGDGMNSTNKEWFIANDSASSNQLNLYEYEDGTYVTNRMVFKSGGNTEFNNSAGTEFVINQAGADVDFRVESTNRNEMLKVDAGNDQVSIQETLSPSSDWTLKVGNARNLYFQPSLGSTGFYNAGMGFSAYVDSSSTPNQIILPAGRNTNGGSVIAANYDGGLGFYVYNHGGTGAATANIFSYEKMTLKPSEAVFNENGSDVDFRVESNNSGHMFFVDASNNSIGINHSGAYDYAQTVAVGNTKAEYSATQWASFSGAQDGSGMLAQNLYRYYDGSSTSTRYVNNHASIGGAGVLVGSGWNTGKLVATNSAATAGAEATNLKTQLTWQTDQVIVNDEGDANIDFRVESDSVTHMFFVDAGQNRIGIGQSSGLHGNRLNIEKSDNQTDGPEIVLKNLYQSSSGDDELGSVVFGGWRDVSDSGSYVAAIAGWDTTYPGTQGNLRFYTRGNGTSDPSDVRQDGHEVLRLSPVESVFNEHNDDKDFRVESDSKTHALHVDAGNNVVRMDANQYVTGTYSGGFNGGWQNVVNLDSIPGVGSQRGMKIRVHANENGRTNTSYGEWIAVAGNTTSSLVKLGQATFGNGHGTAQLQMSGHTLQIKNSNTSSIGSWAVYFEIMQGA